MAVALVGCLAAGAAATNGYFQHGYGPESKSMAGAGTAVPLSAISTYANPATGVYLGTRYDIAAELFLVGTSYTVTGATGSAAQSPLALGKTESDADMFFIPHLGANWKLDDVSAASVVLFGAGGLATDYPVSSFGDASTTTGVALNQLVTAFSYSREVVKNHALGVSLLLAGQQFEAKGLGIFGLMQMSTDSLKIGNNGKDYGFGYGARIGYMGRIHPMVSIGASYQSKILMSEFKEYAGLFAEQGDFDIPANWNVGIAIKPIDKLVVAVDVQQILYSGVAAVGNGLSPLLIPEPNTILLGADGGAGFGWDDVMIYKVGAQYGLTETLTLRAGYSYATQAIPSSEMLLNTLAPAVVQQHVALGATWTSPCGKSVSIAITHALSNSVDGDLPITQAPNIQNVALDMKQWDIEIGFTLK